MSATNTLILGGGFGGLAAANTLRRLLAEEHEITVIDRSPRFHVGAGKTWMMLGERTYEEISRSRRELLDSRVFLVQAQILALDLARKTVATEQGELGWTHLVIALGADFHLTSVPGLAEAAHTFYTVEGAQRLRMALDAFAGGEIAILIPKVPIQCPPAPYEAAMLLHHWFAGRGLAHNARITMYTVEGAPMATAGAEMGQYMRSELAQRGIGFHPQKKTVRVDGDARRVVFEDGDEARFDLLIAVPPHQAPKVVRDAQLTNQSGWIPVDPCTLKVLSAPGAGEVFAVGDVTTVPLPGRYKADIPLALPKAGAFAEAHGRVVAHQIAASILGAAPTESFNGQGFCYLEVGGGRAVKAVGSFFDVPHPVMQKQSPDEAQLRDKLDWVSRHLRPIG